MQTFDSGTAVAQKAVATPTPPRTEIGASLHAELEQRRSEAQTMCEYHAAELQVWQAVAEATGAALDSLNRPRDAQPPRIA